MKLATDLRIGQIVKSKAGRDAGRVFLVYQVIDEDYVSVIDGDLRKLSTPKRKKVKHLNIYNTVLTEFAEKLQGNENLNDAFVRKLLEPFYSGAYRMEVE